MKRLLGCIFLGLFLSSLASAQTIVSGSFVNGTGSNLTGATDVDYLTYMQIDATGGPGNRVSFVVDLGSVQPVNSIALYGSYLYSAFEQMLSDEIRVDASLSDTGPWDLCGSINVGNTRPTDPNPAIGGVNPFTGGNGRMIPFSQKFNTRYLRISGDQGFDNTIRIYHLQINPQVVIQQLTPINTGTTFQPFDPGGGTANSRVAVDAVDGRLNTRTFIGTTATLILDTGAATNVKEFRLMTSESDGGNIPEAGRVIVSSTDDPTNMDTLLTSFDNTTPIGVVGVTQIVLPPNTSKRYYGLILNSNASEAVPNGTGATFRLGEIEYRTADQCIIRNVTATGVEGGTGSSLANLTDNDYNTNAALDQVLPATEGAFILDLGVAQTVSSVAAYASYNYVSAQNMLGGNIIVDAGSSASGPWTQIGSTNVGSTRPTDPDPSIGGPNPWTGGNGRRVVCTPTSTRYVRFRGSFGFDNAIRPYALFVNPPASLHTVSPINNGNNVYDIGGGLYNTRSAVDTVDSIYATRFNPLVSTLALTYDLGTAAPISGVRMYPMENDIGQLPTSGAIKVSSTDDPTNMDTTVGNFGAYGGGGVAQVTFTPVTKRFVQVNINQASRRMSDFEVLRPLADNPIVPVELSSFATE